MLRLSRIVSFKLMMPRKVHKEPVELYGEVTTPNNTVKEEDVNDENQEYKSKLSDFKVDSNLKLKREHVTIEYDQESKIDSKEWNVDEKEVNEDVNIVSSDENYSPCSSTSKKMKCNSKNRPPNWEEVVDNLRKMRKDFDAPVDSMGCDKCIDRSANHKDQRYQSLLSLMLSSRTRDKVTFEAMERLKSHDCSVDRILEMSDEELGKLIKPVAFWQNKVKFIKKSTQMLKDEFDGDIPNNVEDLCKLPGVGPKMAHLCMNTAWGELTGIGVDTHVHRISNRLGWANTKTPECTRQEVEAWMPKELWKEMNHLLVGFGQQTCRGYRPLCKTCLNNKICPFGKQEIKNVKKTRH